MKELAEVCERVGATTKRLEKTALIAEYLRTRPPSVAAIAAVFLSGRAFPKRVEETLQVGGAILWSAVENVAGARGDPILSAAYREHGDLGAAAADVLVAAGHVVLPSLTLPEVASQLRTIARTKGPAGKQKAVEDLLRRATPLESKYILKIITSDLRIGTKESLVEEAIARAFEADLAHVQRANMLLGDIAEALELAASGRLAEAKLRLFHPVGFMLASPAKDASEAMGAFTRALIEDKYDGIRAQAHVARKEVRIYSRTLDDVTAAFPELVAPLASLPRDAILDGEILAWNAAKSRARPFSDLQKRLGRKKVTRAMQRDVPVAFVAFDVLYEGEDALIDRPLEERAARLDAALAARSVTVPAKARGQLSLFDSDDAVVGLLLRAPAERADSPAELEASFVRARDRGNEGLMIKDRDGAYAVGRRGKSWLKLKRELATLDVVVTGVEFGHGKRAKVLSDYTFGVRDGDRLANIGKAYTGLTDVEIAELTRWFFDHTLEDRGHFRTVEPTLVIEVAFDRIMESDRHDGGFALRFPRIVRLRQDKPAAEIDTIEDVRRIFSEQM